MPLLRQRVKEKQVRILYEPVTVFGERSTTCSAQSLERNILAAARDVPSGKAVLRIDP